MTLIRQKSGGADSKVTGRLASQAQSHRQDLQEPRPFAPIRAGNEVDPFTTGEAYFKSVHDALKGAKKSIYIAGWQVNWDVELIDGVRLIDVLKSALDASPELRIYVMPWMSPKVGVNTGDLDTMLAIFQLNAGQKTMRAICCPAASQNDSNGVEATFFSHHQKLVVVDHQIAFIGGMDLAYGRRDDATFSLAHGDRVLNERYNPGVPPLRQVGPSPHFGTAISGADTPPPYLNTVDLLMGSLGSTKWEAGGNTDPSALAQTLQQLCDKADKAALKAVEWASNGAYVVKKGLLYATEQTKAGIRASGQAVEAAGRATEAAMIEAAQQVSTTCEQMRTLDLYGTVSQAEITHPQPSSMASGLRDGERAVIRQVNATSDALQDALQQALGQYFHPMKRLRLRESASTGLPDLIDDAKRSAVSTYNSSVHGVAKAGSVADKASRDARQACMAIAPLTVEVIDSTKREVRRTADAAGQVVQTATGEVNACQQAVLEELIATRNKLNELGASMKTWGDKKVNQGISSVKEGIGSLTALGNAKIDEVMASKSIQPSHINAVIEQLKRLLKLIYVAQLSVTWHGVKAHPALFAPGRKAKAAPAGGLCLDDLQPRQPWQDVHCRIVGQAVHDVAHNFIGRWNATQLSYLADQTLGDVGGLISGAIGGIAGAIAGGSVSAGVGAQRLGARGASHGRELAKIVRERVMIPKTALPPDPDQPKNGTVRVRVLRSASHKLQQQEALAQGQKATLAPKQCEIQAQMCNLIRNATDFVYIENQFFQSGFGQASIDVKTKEGEQKISGPMAALMGERMNQIMAGLTMLGQQQIQQAPPVNAICETLADRIVTAIQRNEPFHVYIVLPEHPEGRLNDITIVGQIHWTMQSLVFADQSLINRIRRGLWAKAHCANPIDKNQWAAALQAAGKGEPHQRPYESIDVDDVAPYLTLLNLRNCEMLKSKSGNKQALRTEQIYVHSKLLIVDDRHVIMGSANINDRSLDGGRDSEIAVMLLDDRKQDVVLHKDTVTVNTLARNLRMELWRKHLGFGTKDGGVVQSGASKFKSLIEQPASKATVNAIQTLSQQNGTAYRSAFAFVPHGGSEDDYASIWPTCPANRNDKEGVNLAAAQMPFDERFWKAPPNVTPKVQVTGFWCDLPTYWTYNENNHPKGMNIKVLTEVTPSTGSEPNSVRTV